MISLIISILCTVALGFAFKEYYKRNLSILSVIIWNYFFCSIIGFGLVFLYKNSHISSKEIFIANALGLLFIIGFNSYAKSIYHNGLALTTVIQKMSVVVTVIIAFLLGDILNSYQKIAVIISIAAIYFLTSPEKKIQKLNYIIFIAAIISACIEILFIIKNKMQNSSPQNGILFTSLIFVSAFIFGSLYMLISIKKPALDRNNILAGLILGVPNFASIYYLNKALATSIPGSVVFPILNCSVILISVILSFFIYKEQLNIKKKIGLILAVIAVYIISKYLS